MSEAPPFWFAKPGIAGWLLSPVGALFGAVSAQRMRRAPTYVSTLPTICVGNFVVGGAGKTPTVLALIKISKSMGLKPGVLSRGYGGSVQEAVVVDPQTHNAHDVGDEPLIAAKLAPTIVSSDRPSGAALLEQQRVDLIIMDDGFQNPSLHKDYSIAVTDSVRGLGNGFVMPAGPLRASLGAQIAKASAILLVGEGKNAASLVRRAAKMAKPILQSGVRVKKPRSWSKRRVCAFAGIADPKKFYASLEACGAEIVGTRNFHDHHPFSAEECRDLQQWAKDHDATLVTTQKDHIRLLRMGEAQDALAQAVEVLEIELVFENPKRIQMIIHDVMERAREARVGRGPKS